MWRSHYRIGLQNLNRLMQVDPEALELINPFEFTRYDVSADDHGPRDFNRLLNTAQRLLDTRGFLETRLGRKKHKEVSVDHIEHLMYVMATSLQAAGHAYEFIYGLTGSRHQLDMSRLYGHIAKELGWSPKALKDELDDRVRALFMGGPPELPAMTVTDMRAARAKRP